MADSPSTSSRLLLVEGPDDEHVVKHLYRQIVGPPEFAVRQMGGVDQVGAEVDAHAKVPGRAALGIVVDANSDPKARWHSIRAGLLQADIALPNDLPSDGAVVLPKGGGLPTVGVWLMPDNVIEGELEDFVSGLISADDVVWPLACSYIDQIPKDERPRKLSKARVHAWLAARAEGARMGGAIGQGKFDLEVDSARAFSEWLRRVFG